MATLLMNLRNVPEDEAAEVRVLLSSHGIPFYETQPGRWGISAGGIWLRDETDATRARELLAAYQQERFRRMRAGFEARQRRGEVDTLIGRIGREPGRMLIYAAIIALVLYLAMTPLIWLWR